MAQPLQLYGWSTRQLEAVAGLLTPAWDAWCAAWGIAHTGPPACEPFTAQHGMASWTMAAGLDGRNAWLHETSSAQLGRSLFGLQNEPRTAAAREVVQACLDDLRRMVSEALALVASSGAAAVDTLPAAGRWDGSVIFAFPLTGQFPLQLVLNAACVAGLVPIKANGVATLEAPRAKLIALETALAGQALRLTIELNACELDLGTLRELDVGDVLPLKHALETPARVLGDGGRHVCDAYLGRTGSRKAAELARGITIDEEMP